MKRLPRCEHLTTYGDLIRKAQIMEGADPTPTNMVIGILHSLASDLDMLGREVPDANALMQTLFPDPPQTRTRGDTPPEGK